MSWRRSTLRCSTGSGSASRAGARHRVAARARRADLHPGELLQTTRFDRIKEPLERRAEQLSRHGIDGINLHRTDWNGGLIALFHRFGLFTFGWDLQHEHELRPALRMGLDAVYSDHVDVMVDAFAAEIGTRDLSVRSEPLPVGLRPEDHERPPDEVVVVDRTDHPGVL